MPSLDTLIPRFKAADRTTRLETLLDYSRKLPPLPERYQEQMARGEHRVHECQTPVAIFPEAQDGKLWFHADVPRESAAIRALLAMLFEALNGQPPETTIAIPPDFVREVMGKIGLQAREAGLSAMVERLRRAARDAARNGGA